MKKRYTLPAVTIDWQETSIGVVIGDDAKLREWLSCLRRHLVVRNFRFHWTEYPNAPEYYNLLGSFCPEYKRDGIYITVNLAFADRYINSRYTLTEFCSMINVTRPSFGWCVNVTVQ